MRDSEEVAATGELSVEEVEVIKSELGSNPSFDGFVKSHNSEKLFSMARLTYEHSNGETTVRQIGNVLDVRMPVVLDVLSELYDVLDLEKDSYGVTLMTVDEE